MNTKERNEFLADVLEEAAAIIEKQELIIDPFYGKAVLPSTAMYAALLVIENLEEKLPTEELEAAKEFMFVLHPFATDAFYIMLELSQQKRRELRAFYLFMLAEGVRNGYFD